MFMYGLMHLVLKQKFSGKLAILTPWYAQVFQKSLLTFLISDHYHAILSRVFII